MLAILESLFFQSVTAILVMTIAATIQSTIDSAILSPATVDAQNLWRGAAAEQINRSRIAIIGTSGTSVRIIKFGGEIRSI